MSTLKFSNPWMELYANAHGRAQKIHLIFASGDAARSKRLEKLEFITIAELVVPPNKFDLMAHTYPDEKYTRKSHPWFFQENPYPVPPEGKRLDHLFMRVWEGKFSRVVYVTGPGQDDQMNRVLEFYDDKVGVAAIDNFGNVYACEMAMQKIK